MSVSYQRHYYHCLKTLLKNRVFVFGKEIIVEDLQNKRLQNSPRYLEGMTVLLRLSTIELSHTQAFTFSLPSSLLPHSSYVINSPFIFLFRSCFCSPSSSA